VILQRPATDPEEMQRAYSPQVLRLLDGLGLTDVFHAWWFVLLLSLVSLSIIAASCSASPMPGDFSRGLTRALTKRFARRCHHV
jgi:cytochrome c biogenesis protein ResB